MLFDTHCHLNDAKFDPDRDSVLMRAREAGIGAIISHGVDIAASKRALALAESDSICFAGTGFHPSESGTWADDSEEQLRLLAASSNRVVAIGEIGLDYYWKPFDAPQQRRVFRAQLALARELQLPVSIHCREAYADMLEDLHVERAHEIGGVSHCFSGTLDDARAIVAMGLFLGVGGSATYPKSADLRETLLAIGLEHIVLETDAPYLAPQPRRGKRNEPAFVAMTADALSTLFKVTQDEIARVTTANAHRAFPRTLPNRS